MDNENLNWITSLRVLATFSVIFLHSASGILYLYGTISAFDWWIGNIYDSIVRFCVPIFLMISGTLILSKDYESTREYLKKRVLRIFYPFLFWSILYISIDLFHKINKGEYLTFLQIFKFILIKLKTGASFHFWYIYMIIGLYLFFPIIQKWLKKSDDDQIKYFLIIWFFSLFTKLPIIDKLIPPIEISYFSGYIGYPILGYYLTKVNFNFKKKKVIYLFLILIGILITILATFFMTQYKGKFYDGFYNYLTPNVVITSIGLFLLFKDFIKINSNIILTLSNYSYGIYLAHIFVMAMLEKLGISYTFINPTIGIPVTSIL
ncbi:acyltransferase, partial [Flavobacterium columnare]